MSATAESTQSLIPKDVRSAGLPPRPGRSTASTGNSGAFLANSATSGPSSRRHGSHRGPAPDRAGSFGAISARVTCSVAAQNAAKEKIDGVLQVTLLLLGAAIDTALGQPRGQMLDHRNIVARGQLQVIHLGSSGILVVAK